VGKTIGGVNDDDGCSVQQTSDGGYIVLGNTGSFGVPLSALFLVKLDSSGNLSWAKTIGGSNAEDYFSVQQTSDGGYIVAAHTYSFGAGSADLFLVKLDSSGNLSWAKTIGGVDEEMIHSVDSVQQTSDGGYIVGGRTRSFGAGDYDLFLVKLDSSGNLSWAKTIGGSNREGYCSVQQTSDGGYIVGGETSGFGAGGWDFLLVKLDSSGNLSWARTIGGSSNEFYESIQQTSDGGYIAIGDTYSFGAGSADLFLVKLDSSGNLSWAKTIGGGGSENGLSVQQTSDGGYIMPGYTSSFGAGGDSLLVKLDSSGDTCGFENSVSPTVTIPSLTVTTPSPTVTTPSPKVTTISPTVTTPLPTVTNVCP